MWGIPQKCPSTARILMFRRDGTLMQHATCRAAVIVAAKVLHRLPMAMFPSDRTACKFISFVDDGFQSVAKTKHSSLPCQAIWRLALCGDWTASSHGWRLVWVCPHGSCRYTKVGNLACHAPSGKSFNMQDRHHLQIRTFQAFLRGFLKIHCQMGI